MRKLAATWLLLATTGIGLAGAGPRDLEAAGTEVFLFLRGLIDTGLLSPDVVGYDENSRRFRKISWVKLHARLVGEYLRDLTKRTNDWGRSFLTSRWWGRKAPRK